MHIGYVLRERPPFSALNFRSGASPFSFWPILPFLRPSLSKFLKFHDRFPRPAQPKRSHSASQTRPGSSGDSYFHPQNGSSSFRSPAFSSSKRFKLVPEPRILTLDWDLVPQPLPIFHFAVAQSLLTKICSE